jgi:hypothetical protein
MRAIFSITLLMILIVFLFAMAAMEKTGAQPRKDELVSFSVASAEVTLHEPLMIDFVVNNTYAETLEFDLGPDRKENFRLTLTRPDRTTRANQLQIDGVARGGEITILPGQSYRQKLLVNEWFDISQQGTYTVFVEMITPIRSKKGQVITNGANGRFTIQVLSRDPDKLREVCDAFFNQIMTSDTSDTYEQVNESAVALSFIKDPVAIPYLERMLKTDRMVELIAIQGLARINDREAVEVLINALILQKPDITASARYTLSQIEVETKDPSLKQQIRSALKKNN